MDWGALKKKLENDLRSGLAKMDQLIESQDFDTELEETFDEEERLMARAISDFQEEILAQTTDPEILLLVEELPLVWDKQIIKRRASLLAKWYRHQAAILREAAPWDFERVFASEGMRKNMRLFHITLKELDHCSVNLHGLKNTALYQAMVAKGKILAVKEDLILAFTEYEELLANEYAKEHTTGHIPERRRLFFHREALVREMHKMGETLYAEGMALERDANELMSSDITHYGELFKQGNHLIEVGKELQQKALLAEEKLRRFWQRPHP